jgi:hypothetical protein
MPSCALSCTWPILTAVSSPLLTRLESDLSADFPIGVPLALSSSACVSRARLGWRLTTLFGNTAFMPIAAPKKKRSLLPLLTVVFLLSYGLMTMLIVEQGEAIQSQRNLIQVLQKDSMELWAMRGKAQTAINAAKARAQAQAATKSPSTHGQVGTPSTQVQKQHSQTQAGKAANSKTALPPVPAADMGDQRRVLITM